MYQNHDSRRREDTHPRHPSSRPQEQREYRSSDFDRDSRRPREYEQEGDRDRFRDRDQRDRNRRRPPSHLQISDEKETGIVCSIKDKYGFIRCAEREEDLFFHFSEVTKSDDDPNIGMEVSFLVAEDSRNNKLSAVNISVLPKGSVIFEVVEDRTRVGTLLKEPSFGSTSSEYMTYGEIEHVMDDNSREILKFTARDQDEPKVPLRVGDELKFRIITNKRTRSRKAGYVVIYRFGGKRETGAIQSLKDNYGFIKCTDIPSSIYFHFRDIVLLQKDQKDLSMGMEVEFSVETDPKLNKPLATRVRGLPKGTISFEIPLPDRIQGVVAKEYSADNYFHRSNSSKEQGIIESKTSESTIVDKYYFTAKSLDNIKQNLRYGDEVEFNVVIKKRTGKKKAINIVLLRAAPEVVENGIICSVHNNKNYGHITCLHRDDDMFFHFSDLEIPSEELHAGMEVEFTVITDSRTNKKKAIKIKPLPQGTVSFEVNVDFCRFIVLSKYYLKDKKELLLENVNQE